MGAAIEHPLIIDHTQFPESFFPPLQLLFARLRELGIEAERRELASWLLFLADGSTLCTIAMHPTTHSKGSVHEVIYEVTSPDGERRYASLESKSPLAIDELSRQIRSAIDDVQDNPNSLSRRAHP